VIAITIAVALVHESPWPQPVDQSSDAEFCNIARRVTADLPPWTVDATRRIDEISVSCSLRTITYEMAVLAPMSDAWREEMKQQWNHRICDDDAFGSMARRGWRFTQNVTFEGGKRITQDAHC
jgi:hypothetical protein